MSKIKKAINQMGYVLKDDQRKPLLKIMFEATHSGILVKELPIHYFTHLLYKKDVDNYKGYIGFKKGTNIKFNVLPKQNMTILNDKKNFSKVMMDNNIKTPMIIAESSSNRLAYDDKNYEVLNKKQLKEHLCRLVSIYQVENIFVKPNDGVGGINAFKLNPQNDSEKLEMLFELMKSLDFIFQKVIEQHEHLSALNDSSINTARMHVYYDGEKAEVVSGMLRIGLGGMEVDNGGAGGIFIPIDFKTWSLKGKAEQHLSLGGKKYEKHPGSNIKLDGYKLPFREETFDILMKTAEIFKGKIIGWDVAFTPEGPLIIEGNFTFNLFMCQKSCRGLLNHPKYREIFSEYL